MSIIKYRYRNTRTCAIKLVIEPWGQIWDVIPGMVYDVVFESAETTEALEIDDGEKYFTIYAPVASSLKIFCNGHELRDTTARALPLPKAA